ncbi:DUF4386 domain-containing protein [Reinekea blandensis]|uniref:DUF4386 domain-containing protein n=1 Tax=Reinekea blandensis MED297 TaxID=314283 RepID=A4BK80_9GAMM|nr:DUF4386 domain-containing protein [Reinekea blandensis]EAR07447.1 hypothetical protein MED297_05009 [Reinekea sp. MED297] [Reinekea blandensis MED297]
MLNSLTIHQSARVAGFLYLLLAPLGVMALIYIPEFLQVAGNPIATQQNLANNAGMVGLSIFSALFLQIIQLGVAYCLYRMLRPVSDFTARLIIVFTVLAMPIAMLMEVFKSVALMLAVSPEMAAGFSTEQIATGISLLLEAHADGVMIAHIFWGLWLLPMGWLIARSGYLPAWIGWLLIIAGFGYLIDTLLWSLMSEVPFTVAEYTFAGEIILPLWLLIKGVNKSRVPNTVAA